ncbi:hypothetical protein E0K83_12450 [Gramella sp. BOM4]|nr:hypothetical protein [Christiangramia bathymodioli]
MKNHTYEFKLPLNPEQDDMALTKREFITSREEGGSRFALYSLYRFFVEMEYNVKNNKIVGKGRFVDGELLDKYRNEN